MALDTEAITNWKIKGPTLHTLRIKAMPTGLFMIVLPTVTVDAIYNPVLV